VLVLSNSLATTLAMWDPQMPALAERFRLVRYDLRGHGGSPVPPGPFQLADLGADLVALLDRLGISRAHLCGVSLGGMAAMWAAANAPQRVGRLILCSTATRIGTRESWAQRSAAVRDGGMASIADTLLGIWFTREYRSTDPAGFERMRAMLLSTDADVYAACGDTLGRTDLRPLLASIRAPTLVVAGSEDPSTPPEEAYAITEGIRDCRVTVIPGAAHLANMERPAEVSRAILSHTLDN
jgi:3-oxoadipate enol-lactonase